MDADSPALGNSLSNSDLQFAISIRYFLICSISLELNSIRLIEHFYKITPQKRSYMSSRLGFKNTIGDDIGHFSGGI